ncbi:hypothetical protein AK812_SmicGene41970 [Symbiodinium microadriaticum]|uniref:Ubiquitin-like domain-containing protein n=1 Tax=Symbiodinium microadriaticum TaxID=2951 RepID=A0A1Q9C4S5_SYMMI|nr:hypothetical protein AK812_SmicGene41970 [Symbiodinium microadriaticum]
MSTDLVRVTNLAGTVIVELQPVPGTLRELKAEVEKASGIPVALQKLVKGGDVLEELELGSEGFEAICVKDETPMFTWDTMNPDIEQLQIEGSVIRSPDLHSDYVNVLTQEPIQKGIHYYEFVLHKVGDEQWCGVTMSPEMAGRRYSGRSLDAWCYYVAMWGVEVAPAEASGMARVPCTHRERNVINMLVDGDKRIVAFALEGRVQGACKIPGEEPLYVLTHMDTKLDHVELRKPMLEDAPAEALHALSGALLDIK